MCDHCGCSTEKATLVKQDDAGASHKHLNLSTDAKTLQLKEAILDGNTRIAKQNREWFIKQNVTAINLMGTPGAGKTQLLEATLANIIDLSHVAILEGDQQTTNDAKRIKQAGGHALQINTGTGCHLDAEMVHAGLHELDLQADSLLFIENVGNLVCPALFDLGETERVSMMAVTDGEDKPEKYPHMFSESDLILVNKIDLLPYLDFSEERLFNAIHKLNPKAKVIKLSAKTGEGMDDWMHWLNSRH